MRQKELKKLKHGGRKHIPLPTGPFPVGCLDFMTGYSIEGSFFRLYYPCTNNSDTLEKQLQWPAWLPHEDYLNGYASFLKVPKRLFKLSYRYIVGDVFIPAVWEAEPSKGHFPVVIFSHGVASCRTTYTTICLELASQGYIVAAVEHRDNSACHSYFLRQSEGQENEYKMDSDQSEDGYHYPEDWDYQTESRLRNKPAPIREWVNYDQRSLSRKEYPERKRQLRQRTEECVRALDILEALNKGEPVVNILDPFFKANNFEGIMDMSKVSLAGHSFGGATTIHTLSIDLRFKVGLCLDTWMLPLMKDDDVMAMVTQPILFVNMEKFQTNRNLRLMSKLENSEVERKVVTIKGSNHLDQCDMSFVCGWVQYKFLGGFSRVNRFTAMDTTTRLMMEFLGKHLDTTVDKEWEDYLTTQGKNLSLGIKPKLKTPLTTFITELNNF